MGPKHSKEEQKSEHYRIIYSLHWYDILSVRNLNLCWADASKWLCFQLFEQYMGTHNMRNAQCTLHNKSEKTEKNKFWLDICSERIALFRVQGDSSFFKVQFILFVKNSFIFNLPHFQFKKRKLDMCILDRIDVYGRKTSEAASS